MWNEKIQIYSKFKIFKIAFLEKNGPSFFVKFVTFSNVLVLVVTFCYLVKQEQG